MAIECCIITALFVFMTIIFFRNKRNLWGWATLPLILVPLAELLFDLFVPKVLSIPVSPFVRMTALLVAVAASCAWIGFVSVGMKNKKRRITYIGICNLFNVLLAAILIYNILIEIGY